MQRRLTALEGTVELDNDTAEMKGNERISASATIDGVKNQLNESERSEKENQGPKRGRVRPPNARNSDKKRAHSPDDETTSKRPKQRFTAVEETLEIDDDQAEGKINESTSSSSSGKNNVKKIKNRLQINKDDLNEAEQDEFEDQGFLSLRSRPLSTSNSGNKRPHAHISDEETSSRRPKQIKGHRKLNH